MYDRYSDAARMVVQVAESEARRMGHPHVGTEHLLLGLLAAGDGSAAATLHGAGVTLDAARSKVAEAVGARRPPGARAHLELSSRASRALARASRASLQRRDPHVGTADVLRGMLDVEGTAGQVLRGLGIETARLRTDVGSNGHDSPAKAVPPPAAEPTPAPVRAPMVDSPPRTLPPSSAPACRSCRAQLVDTLRHQVLRSVGTSGNHRDIVVVFCAACGDTVGAFPS